MSLNTFDLVPAIEQRIKTYIECLECCGKNLYIGTRESFVICFVLEEKVGSDGNILFNIEQKKQKYLELKKPIVLMKAASALNRILLLCDGNLVILDMFNLEVLPMSKLKNVTYFCINENPEGSNPFSVEICVARRKQVQIYHFTDDKVIHMRDVSIHEQAIVMSMDGQCVCAALTSKYVIIDVEKSDILELFPCEELETPLVKRITKEEFLLVGPSGLGMFVTSAGISQRPPLSWGENIISVAYSHPYLIVLSSEFLTIYSILDQQPKQRIPFRGGRYLDNFDGKIYVASSDIICALLPVPWEKQVQDLLKDKKVNEALELARYSNKAGLSREQSKKILKDIQQRAGFIEFSMFRFDEARELFREGELDIRELISLFPQLMPSNSSFSRASPPLHDIINISEMCSTAPHVLSACYKFLLHYLEDIRGTSEATGSKLEVDTALLKLYAEANSLSLLSFIQTQDVGCNSKESIECLMHHKRFHALALFHCKLGEVDKALVLWSKLIAGDYNDPLFPGLPYLIDFLCKLNDLSLVWKYADFVLERDQELGVKIIITASYKFHPNSVIMNIKGQFVVAVIQYNRMQFIPCMIFIDRQNDVMSERMRPDLVLEHLNRYSIAIVCYLEHLVFAKKLEKEKYHTHLAVLYLDSVLRILKLPEPKQGGLSDARKKLQHLLHFSTLYRIQLLLEKALESQLHIECAILHGRLEEHEKALKILVHKLQDHMAAEDYCLRMSEGKDRKFRHRLFYMLLCVYLDPSMDEHQREDLLAPAVQLLNSELAEFDVMKVLQLIPSHWSIAIIDQFLNKAVRSTVHRKYVSRLQSALSRSVNLQIRFAKIHLESTPVVMTDDRLCSVCKRPFLEPAFVRYPNGIVTHLQCAKQQITCPNSGQSYTCQKSDIR